MKTISNNFNTHQIESLKEEGFIRIIVDGVSEDIDFVIDCMVITSIEVDYETSTIYCKSNKQV